MSDAVNRSAFNSMLCVVFVAFMFLHLFMFGMPTEPSVGLATALWRSASTGLLAVAIFYFLFRKWLWRLRFLQPWLVRYPDITGTWYARFESVTFADTFHSLVLIGHELDRIRFRSERNQSMTIGVATMLARPQGDEVVLYSVYDSEVLVPDPSAGRAEHASDHRGCFRLRLSGEHGPKEQWRLNGIYWTNKQRKGGAENDLGTWGRVTMQYQGRRIVTKQDPSAHEFLMKGE